MSDNQKEKFTPEQIRQREEIGAFIEKATNRKISDVINEYFPTSKSTYYNNVVKTPIKLKFVVLIKNKLGVDLSEFLRPKETIKVNEGLNWEQEYWKATGKIELLEGEIIKHKVKEVELKNKLGELGAENDRLYKEIEKLQARIPKEDTGS